MNLFVYLDFMRSHSINIMMKINVMLIYKYIVLYPIIHFKSYSVSSCAHTYCATFVLKPSFFTCCKFYQHFFLFTTPVAQKGLSVAVFPRSINYADPEKTSLARTKASHGKRTVLAKLAFFALGTFLCTSYIHTV